MVVYGYARCSTSEDKQDINRQIRELKAAGADEVIFEYERRFISAVLMLITDMKMLWWI